MTMFSNNQLVFRAKLILKCLVEKMMFGKSCFRLFGKSSVIWNFCNKFFSVQSFFLDITFSRIHESKKLRYKRIVFRWLHAIILKFNSAGLV